MKSLALLSAVALSCLTAFAEPALASSRLVPYYDFNGTALVRKEIADPITLTNGADRIGSASGEWYVVEGAVTSVNLRVEGTAHLILCDGAELTARTDDSYGTAGIRVGPGASLFIYGQENQTGLLTATAATEHGAGIGGNEGESCGAITINGGVVTARGGYTAAGIGGGSNESASSGAGGVVTINGGVVNASCGGYGGAGVGGGCGGSGGTVTVNGGRVTAQGAQWDSFDEPGGAGIGNGGRNGQTGCRVTINGGTVMATAGGAADDIGCGANAYASATVMINGGSVLRANGRGVQTLNASSANVHCVTVKCPKLDGSVGLVGLEHYGTNDIFAIDGKVFLHLPDGTHSFSLSDGTKTYRYCAVVNGRDVAVEPFESSVGFFVNGVDVGEGRSVDWTYEDKVLKFTADRTYVLSGLAMNDEVQIDVDRTGVSLVLSNAVVFTKGRPALCLDYNSLWKTPILMAGGTSYLVATNAAGGASVPAATINNHVDVGLAPGGDRLESMICVSNSGDSPAIDGEGSVAVDGGTFLAWSDGRAIAVEGGLACGEAEVMKTGDAPRTLRLRRSATPSRAFSSVRA